MATVPNPISERRLIGLADVRQRQPDALEEVVLAGAGGGQAEQVFELIEHQQNRGAEREADDHRVRDIARQVAEPQQRDARLDDADDEREQDHGRDSFGIAEADQRAQHGDRNRIGRAVDELLRRIEQRARRPS